MGEINDVSLQNDVKEIISRVARIDKGTIKDNSSLRKDLWIDSLQAIQIIALIEEKFNIKIDEVEILNVDTYMDIVDMIKEYRENQTE